MIDKKGGIENRLNPRMFDAEPIKRCTLDECKGACCIFGVWVDSREVKYILSNADMIMPFMPEETRNPENWFAPIEDDDKHSPSGKVVHTAVETRPDHPAGTACIFWQSDGKCILQIAGVQNKFHPWRFKPYYCIMHPIDLDEEGRFTLDTNEELLTERGSCLRAADHPIPLLDTFKEELHYLLGHKGYNDLLEGRNKETQDQEPN